MKDIKILYITTEISPFLQTSPLASLIRNLVEASTKQKAEVRVFMPSFGVINQLKNCMHSISRLSGLNVAVGKEDFSLVVKVASIRALKVQVYFTDNEDLFQRKGIFRAKNGTWYKDNDIRSIFFCKSVLAAIKELNWTPDIIHCHGWFSAFVPMYLKTTYKNSSVFKNTSCLYTFYPEHIPHIFKQDIFKKARLREVKEEHLAPIGQGEFKGLMNLASTFADRCTRAFDQSQYYEPTWLEKFNVTYVPGDQQLADNYILIYQQLLEENSR